MERRVKSTEETIRDWIVQASEVAPGKRQKIIDMLYAGSTIGEVRVAVDVPLPVVLEIAIEEMRKKL